MQTFKQFVAEESPLQALKNLLGKKFNKNYAKAIKWMKDNQKPAADAARLFAGVDARTLAAMTESLEEATSKQEYDFHKALDKLVHKTFGPRPEEEDEEDEMDEGYFEREKRAFKRREHEAEYKRELEIERQRKARESGVWHVYIDGKVWKKGGKPVEFNGKRHANAAALSIQKKDPNKNVRLAPQAYTEKNGGVIKEESK